MSAAKRRLETMKINDSDVPFQREARETVELLSRFPDIVSVTCLDLKAALCNVAILCPD